MPASLIHREDVFAYGTHVAEVCSSLLSETQSALERERDLCLEEIGHLRYLASVVCANDLYAYLPLEEAPANLFARWRRTPEAKVLDILCDYGHPDTFLLLMRSGEIRAVRSQAVANNIEQRFPEYVKQRLGWASEFDIPIGEVRPERPRRFQTNWVPITPELFQNRPGEPGFDHSGRMVLTFMNAIDEALNRLREHNRTIHARLSAGQERIRLVAA